MTDPLFQRVHISALRVDPIVQRALDSRRAAALAENFNPDSVGALVVSLREDGNYYILDGQHRKAAAIIAKYDGKLNCLVHKGLSLEAEAALFRTLNESKLVGAIDKFRIRIVEEDKDATAINNIMNEYGWQIYQGSTKTTGAFAAVVALEKVYNGAGVLTEGKHDALVQYTIYTITKAWGHDSAGGHAAIVGGLGQLFARFGRNVDIDKLTHEMSKCRPVDLVARAKSMKDNQGGTVPAAMAKVLVGLHNKSRRTNRLPDWRWTR